MKIGLLVLFAAVLAIAATYYFSLSSNADSFTMYSFSAGNGRQIIVSRHGIFMASAPDHYDSNGFDHIESYITRLLSASEQFRSVSFFTPDGERGFSLRAMDGVIEASTSVEWKEKPREEAAIRTFFESRGIRPSEDYLSDNGDEPDATRYLSYPISGNAEELTALTKLILQELIGISPSVPLDIEYTAR